MDNTEGSRAIIRTFKARKNLELRLSDQQISIVLGSILGDAYVHPQGKICFEHGEKQYTYLRWKFNQLKALAYPKVSQVLRIDKRTNQTTTSWRFFLRQFFRPLRNSFYPNGKKTIPLDLNKWLSPQLLAVWYMDDGYLDKQKYPLFMTENFSQQDVELLTCYLKQSFLIDCSITHKRRLRVLSNSTSRFFHLVEPFIHPSLDYKLP